MNKPKRLGAAVFACLALAGCAPLILGRTPPPAAPEEWKSSLNAGYPSNIDYPPNQTPIAQPVNLFLARGVGSNTELNGTLSLGGNSLRLGSKTLLVDDMVPVAIDYGVSLPDIDLDAGLLFSTPSRVSSHTVRCAAS